MAHVMKAKSQFRQGIVNTRTYHITKLADHNGSPQDTLADQPNRRTKVPAFRATPALKGRPNGILKLYFQYLSKCMRLIPLIFNPISLFEESMGEADGTLSHLKPWTQAGLVESRLDPFFTI